MSIHRRRDSVRRSLLPRRSQRYRAIGYRRKRTFHPRKRVSLNRNCYPCSLSAMTKSFAATLASPTPPRSRTRQSSILLLGSNRTSGRWDGKRSDEARRPVAKLPRPDHWRSKRLSLDRTSTRKSCLTPSPRAKQIARKDPTESCEHAFDRVH